MISTGEVYEQVDCIPLDQVMELLITKYFGLH